MLRVEPFWNKVAEAAGHPERREIVIVLGGIDTGKTTFCSYLHQSMPYSAALIDCDPGQSMIGPPATIGALLADGTRRLGFVGAVSPQGHLLQAVCGIKKLTDWSLKKGMHKLILDSCGFVSGNAALEFQFQVIDLVSPTRIVAFQRGIELEDLLSNFTDTTVHRLAVSGAVKPRTADQRRAYRRERFRQYFEDAKELTLALKGLGMHGMVPESPDALSWRGMLVALCDHEALVLALGIVEAIGLEQGTIVLSCPPFDASHVRSIQFGSIRLDRSGRELT